MCRMKKEKKLSRDERKLGTKVFPLAFYSLIFFLYELMTNWIHSEQRAVKEDKNAAIKLKS